MPPAVVELPRVNVNQRIRPARAGTHGFFREGVAESLDTADKIKEKAKMGAMGAAALRYLAPQGALGFSTYLGIGAVLGIKGAVEGYRRAKEKEEPFTVRQSKLQLAMRTAQAEVRGADRKVWAIEEELQQAHSQLDGIMNDIEIAAGAGPADPHHAIDYLENELTQYAVILEAARKAQTAQEKANQAILDAEKELRKAEAMPQRGPGRPEVRNPRTGALITRARQGAIDPNLAAERNNAIQTARKKLHDAHRDRDLADSVIGNTTMREILDTINDARGLSNRLPLPPAPPAPRPAGAVDTSVVRTRDVQDAFDADGNPVPVRQETITDFNEIISLVESLQEDAAAKRTDIIAALDKITEKEAELDTAEGSRINAEENQRYTEEEYLALVPPGTNLEQAEANYERRLRNRRIAAAIGAAVVNMTAYFGGGVLLNGVFNILAGINNPASGGMAGFTEDISRLFNSPQWNPATTGRPWWEIWFG
jgi:hypothetical protein